MPGNKYPSCGAVLCMIMMLLALLSEALLLRSLDTAPVSHFTLARRGGSFTSTESPRDNINLTHVVQLQVKAESRFNLTKREVKGNRLVRKAKLNAIGGHEEGVLMGNVAADGIW